MKPHKKGLSEKDLAYFNSVLEEIGHNSRFHECDNFIQHGKTTVKEHCIQVAQTAYHLSKKWKLKVDEKELIRGALLHDYFLYDWHEKKLKNQIHGFTHPRKALKEASKDFSLSDKEKNMILHHMFPLTPCPPKYKEGWLLCLADKICATKETIHRK